MPGPSSETRTFLTTLLSNNNDINTLAWTTTLSTTISTAIVWFFAKWIHPISSVILAIWLLAHYVLDLVGIYFAVAGIGGHGDRDVASGLGGGGCCDRGCLFSGWVGGCYWRRGGMG
ncbi:uncharacterized protein ASPGLDRAFT_43955 [Aspergillus glaucus CBS 516.65]|uniref:Uncharacterized protein n=1 Tax=Aspergillus glaucus CBS 516.65 TaxID=1160497 RepID=A0A1L9VU38_ASPGL|nr:hypothetical protein ASPGLDRAFT_43955 [Aspergillus glaucus CBS 516.65]OJJ87406.1 hypothetical protein ASPGLDRAFT_43955 [Aspergillus glaucus CBS 516.65]